MFYKKDYKYKGTYLINCSVWGRWVNWTIV